MKTLTLRVPEQYVARVDRALKREGLGVRSGPPRIDLAGRPLSEADNVVVEGTPPADVPRVLAHDGPDPRAVLWKLP